MANEPIRVISFADEPLSERRRRLDAERVVDGDPRHRTRSHFESPDGKLIAGIWESTPGKWRAFTGRDEFCYIVEGHVRLVSEDGEARTFRTGDAFLIPNGFEGYWEVIEPTTKHFVIRHYAED